MKFVDCHSHSLHYSFDATQSLDDLLDDAKGKGLSGIILTDHYDKNVIYEQGLESIFNLEHYFSHLNPIRETTAQQDMKLLIGIELGWLPGLADLYREIAQKYPFDSLVLSLHAMDNGLDIFMNRQVFDQGVNEAYSRALTQMQEMMLQVPDFTVLGHYDYVSRYVPGKPLRMEYQPLRDEFDQLFTTLIHQGKALEFNTRTIFKFKQLGFKGMDAWPDMNIYKRYKELGGEFICLGSDSHQTGQAGYLFDDAAVFLKEAGFNAITHYENRLPVQTLI